MINENITTISTLKAIFHINLGQTVPLSSLPSPVPEENLWSKGTGILRAVYPIWQLLDHGSQKLDA